jgi:hypothetical protein
MTTDLWLMLGITDGIESDAACSMQTKRWSGSIDTVQGLQVWLPYL